jgi:rare lipoprotein A
MRTGRPDAPTASAIGRPKSVCAHKTRRLGSVARVTVIATGRSIACPINDRGPYVRGRILDLSFGAARALGVRGLARVRIE